jgi:transposase
MTDLHDHDPDPGDHDPPIPVITMRRSRRSRWTETRIQELGKQHGYTGSYETVKRFVRPLHAEEAVSDLTQRRFETPPGGQSQIDWGQARVYSRTQPVELHIFVLTLGFSRRGFYRACADERLAQFLDAHEAAFAHFGGHTREHLYDRPRTVCAPGRDDGKVVWNATFKAFADYWGFEPRLCPPYRAQTKGKVKSGVKYFKRNFLPGASSSTTGISRNNSPSGWRRSPTSGSTGRPTSGPTIASSRSSRP